MWLALSLLALSPLAQAGDLRLDLTVDGRTHHLALADMAACGTSEAHLSGATELDLQARVRVPAPDRVEVDLDVEATVPTEGGVHRVHTAPRFAVRPDEPATLTLSGPDGDVALTVVAAGFSPDQGCRRDRSGAEADRARMLAQGTHPTPAARAALLADSVPAPRARRARRSQHLQAD